MVNYTKKKVMQDGSVKVYTYTVDSGYYYKKKKEEMGEYRCPLCNCEISYNNKTKHLKTQKCKKLSEENKIV
jgi:hypothetical protein